MSQTQPHEVIWNLTTAYVSSTCLHAVAELGVADQLGDEPMTAAALAARCKADPGALERVLQLLAAAGVFQREWRPVRSHAGVAAAAQRRADVDAGLSS